MNPNLESSLIAKRLGNDYGRINQEKWLGYLFFILFPFAGDSSFILHHDESSLSDSAPERVPSRKSPIGGRVRDGKADAVEGCRIPEGKDDSRTWFERDPKENVLVVVVVAVVVEPNGILGRDAEAPNPKDGAELLLDDTPPKPTPLLVVPDASAPKESAGEGPAATPKPAAAKFLDWSLDLLTDEDAVGCVPNAPPLVGMDDFIPPTEKRLDPPPFMFAPKPNGLGPFVVFSVMDCVFEPKPSPIGNDAEIEPNENGVG